MIEPVISYSADLNPVSSPPTPRLSIVYNAEAGASAIAPQDKADAMVQHLASLAEKRLIISFAPKTLAYSILKRIGELFPGPSKATRAYLHAEDDVVAAAARSGWRVRRGEMTATSFYFSRLLEFERA